MPFSQAYELRNAAAATFPTSDAVHECVQQLREAGFEDTWVGKIKRVESGNEREDTLDPRGSDLVVEADSLFQRLFGEGQKRLHDVLQSRGISEAGIVAAHRLEPGNVILTVDSENDLEKAMRIIRASGGTLLTSGAGEALEPPNFVADTPVGDHRAEDAFPDAYSFVRK